MNTELKCVTRLMKKHKGYTFVNIVGLAAGMTVAMLIFLYIRFELSYDTHHARADRIFRVTRRYHTPTGYHPHFARVPETWVNQLPEEFPEIEHLIRFQWEPQVDLRIGEEKFRAEKWFTTDTAVFDVFSFSFIQGDIETALAEPRSLVLTERAALKHFGSTDVIGKEVARSGFRAGEHIVYNVTGVIESLPSHSHFQIDFLASYIHPESRQGWAWIYLLFEPGTDSKVLEAKFPEFIEKYGATGSSETSFLHLQALTDIHLRSHLDREIEPNGDIRSVRIFQVIALIVMLIACFNFTNLQTARSVGRMQEIGIRKVLGAGRTRLILSFLLESTVFASLAFIIALGAVVLIFPAVNAMVDHRMNFTELFDWPTAAGFIGLLVITGLTAGSYPAAALSSPGAVDALTAGSASTPSGRRSKTRIRKLLVALQFMMSVTLIICALLTARQFSYMSSARLGMNKSQVMAIPDISRFVRAKYPAFKNELLKMPGIAGVSASMDTPSRDILDAGFCRVEGVLDDADAPALAVQSVDENYIDFMEIDMAGGRSFRNTGSFEVPDLDQYQLSNLQAFVLSKTRTYLINESALSVFGWTRPEEALGKRIDWRNNAFQTAYGEIIGVVRDYHYTSLKSKIRPLVIMNEPLFLSSILIRMDTQNIRSAITSVEKVWDRFFPDQPFHYVFTDEMFERLYRAEARQGRLLGWFSILAVFIAFLGLFGLTVFTTEQRTREIGIRKVVGATVRHILTMIYKEYTVWIITSAVLAWPLAYWAMSRWLQTYAYRIRISPVPFVTATASALLVGILAVTVQAFRAAAVNPVDALHHE